MKKMILIVGLLILSHITVYAKMDPRPEAQSNIELSIFENFWRGINDFIFEEALGKAALNLVNEEFIRNIIKELDMEDYCIELRSMSNYAQQGFSVTDILVAGEESPFAPFGRANIYSIPSWFSRKSLTKVYISEEWFSSLENSQKEALIKQELMHIKFGHGLKQSIVFIGALLGSLFIINKYNQTSNAPATSSFKSFIKQASTLFASLEIGLTSALFFTAFYAKKLQKDADLAAAKTMNSTDGFINLLKNMQEHTEDYDSKFLLKRLVNRIANPIRALFRLKPSFDDRIAYISALQ